MRLEIEVPDDLIDVKFIAKQAYRKIVAEGKDLLMSKAEFANIVMEVFADSIDLANYTLLKSSELSDLITKVRKEYSGCLIDKAKKGEYKYEGVVRHKYKLTVRKDIQRYYELWAEATFENVEPKVAYAVIENAVVLKMKFWVGDYNVNIRYDKREGSRAIYSYIVYDTTSWPIIAGDGRRIDKVMEKIRRFLCE